MKVVMSKFLTGQKQALKSLVNILSKDFGYVSVMGTDTCGKRYTVQGSGVSINDSMWEERGFVVRVYNGVNYSEFSFNQLSPDSIDSLAQEIKSKLLKSIKGLEVSSVAMGSYPVIQEDELKKSYVGEIADNPGYKSDEDKIKKMTEIKDAGFGISKLVADFRISYEEVHISKIFISENKEMEQTYIWSQGGLFSFVRKDGSAKFFFKTFSGLNEVELIDKMVPYVNYVVETSEKLLAASPAEPGEYEIVCSPEVTGLIVHEAFGHGVEMDMFVKKRAKAVEYLGKPVASELVTMRDGATSASHVASYLFDDEGVLGTDTLIIEKGILKTGISDMLSALRLNTVPTGNGRRESFERKAYARMTNSFFIAGEDKLEDMIASIKSGYLLDGVTSGMEDPKNWGIQCMMLLGHQIKDGKLTGKIVSPVIMTGYVPDLLKSINMVSSDGIEYFGSGACGKGHKELAKVSDGGPYLKTRARLG